MDENNNNFSRDRSMINNFTTAVNRANLGSRIISDRIADFIERRFQYESAGKDVFFFQQRKCVRADSIFYYFPRMDIKTKQNKNIYFIQ